MVASVEPRVEIDERIRGQQVLFDAITSAMAELGRHSTPLVPLPALIRWQLVPLDPSSVELAMWDTPDASDAGARRVFRTADLDDPYTRDVGTLRTWGDLLRTRSVKGLARIDALIRRIDFEAIQRALDAMENEPQTTPPSLGG